MAKRGLRLNGELSTPTWRAELLKDLHTRLRLRYPEKECALFHEVRNETGWSSSPRYVDALAMGLWPSRGLQLEGFECKVDRSDWLRELRAPEKADAIAPYCDLWWLVTPSEPEVAKLDEVPPTWGWLVPQGKAFRVAKPATPNASPAPIDRAFLASVFRAAQGEATIAAKLDAMRAEMRRERDQGIEWARESEARRANDLRKSVERFEGASGIKIDQWSGDRVGEKVRALQALEAQGESVQSLIERAIERIDNDRAKLTQALSAVQDSDSRALQSAPLEQPK